MGKASLGQVNIKDTTMKEWGNLIHSVICLLLKKLKSQCNRNWESEREEGDPVAPVNWLHCLGQSFNLLIPLCRKKLWIQNNLN